MHDETPLQVITRVARIGEVFSRPVPDGPVEIGIPYRDYRFVEAADPCGGKWLVQKDGQTLTRCYSRVECQYFVDVRMQGVKSA